MIGRRRRERQLRYMKIALVYDRVNKWGGAERVLLAFHECFADAPLYTSVYDPSKARWAQVFGEVRTSFLQKIPFARSNHEYLASLMPVAFESFDFSGFDLVISVTSEAAKGIVTGVNTKHVCYCLSPTRYLWSHYDFYFRNDLLRVISRPFVGYLRNWDRFAAQRPDAMIGISSEVCKRIKKFYGRDSDLVYPPVDIKRFQNSKSQKLQKKGNFYLVVSRLVKYKRVELVIEAFNELGLPLVVVGTGSQEAKLRNMAKKNIKFVGFVTEDKLIEYYSLAKALIFPQNEDFGLVAVEAMACGTAVIAYKAGGALDIVKDGENGLFFERQDKESLMRAVNRFEKMNFDESGIIASTKRFSKEEFGKRLLEVLEKYV